MSNAPRKSPVVSPIALPAPGRQRKDVIIPVRVSAATAAQMEAELASLGITTPRDRMDFYRGALYAGITNARHARLPQWQAMIHSIQPLVRKHLGIGMSLEGADATMLVGRGL